MVRSSLISEDSLDTWDIQGPPICFNNLQIRKMLELAHAGKDDVFYDLDSGWGQNLIIALTEYDVKKAVGVEDDRDRYDFSVKRLKEWKIPKKRWEIVPRRFEDVLSGKAPQANPHEASMIFYGLANDESILNDIARNLSRHGRLVYYYNCFFPEILPVDNDFPFYLSVAPFRRPSSELERLAAVVKKERVVYHLWEKTGPL
jgi:hypothetical protein